MINKKSLLSDCKSKATCPVLCMTENELDRRLSRAVAIQPQYAANDNFTLQGLDAAKLIPTVKSIVIALGLVEIEPNHGFEEQKPDHKD